LAFGITLNETGCIFPYGVLVPKTKRYLSTRTNGSLEIEYKLYWRLNLLWREEAIVDTTERATEIIEKFETASREALERAQEKYKNSKKLKKIAIFARNKPEATRFFNLTRKL
jgi:hypothetical protein